MKSLVIVNIALILILILGAILFVRNKSINKPAPVFDSLAHVQHNLDSVLASGNKHLPSVLKSAEKKDSIISLKYENKNLAFKNFDIDSLQREQLRVINRLDNRKCPY